MKFYKVREALLQGNSIMNLPLRVTFYARVSTDKEEQLNSLDNQISFFEDYIKQNKHWIYIEGYIDEGISGSSVKGRKNFLKMIEDAKAGYFDLIITKEVSRFSRNLSDSIKYTQELMFYDVGVYFQSNGINTYDPNSEFILNMMGSVAQEEVKRLSLRIKWGQKEAIKKGRILGSSSITGYTKKNSKLEIIPEEEEKVKMIFELYATDRYGLSKLALQLHKKGIHNSKGNIYDKDTLKRIIQNPKYKGIYRGHTTEVIDYRTKKRIIIPKEEQIIYQDESIPAIVSEELWDKANEILNQRSQLMKESKNNAKRVERKHAYTSKIFCEEHDCPYQRMINQKRKRQARWACGNYIRYRKEVCESPIIAEVDLNYIWKKIMTYLFPNTEELVKEMLHYYSAQSLSKELEQEQEKLKQEIKMYERKKEKILELNIEGNLSNKEFQLKNEKYNDEIKNLEKRIQDFSIEKLDTLDKFLKLEKSLNRILTFEENIQVFIDQFLEEIIVEKINCERNKLRLDIYLNLEEKPLLSNAGCSHKKRREKEIYNDKVDSLDERSKLKNKFLYYVYIVSED